MKKELIKKEWHVPEKYHVQVREKPESFYDIPHEYRIARSSVWRRYADGDTIWG